jgi:hypothetical protein
VLRAGGPVLLLHYVWGAPPDNNVAPAAEFRIIGPPQPASATRTAPPPSAIRHRPSPIGHRPSAISHSPHFLSTQTAMSQLLAERPPATEYAPYYARYIDRIPDGDILHTLEAQLGETLALLRGIPESRGEHRYAPGKWTIKELVGHVVDTERIFAFRGLWIARGDTAPLPGYEQDDWVARGGFGARTLRDLAGELEHVRLGNLVLFRGLTDEAWMRRGVANNVEFTARAIPFILAGHERHHMGMLQERYLKD